ncbi:MAG: dCTP deaminase [Candidatus Pacebacteria bacterium]|nr:dCTP deaminase [Candidatus Paceibacterota bacterium]
MSVLTHDELLIQIEQKNIEITPFDPQMIGPASIDFHLGNQFRYFETNNTPTLYHVDNQADYQQITKLTTVDDYFMIQPQQMVLGITQERLKLSSNLCAWIEGRSSIGRLGLTVHITAGFIQPGVNNQQVLEIFNSAPIPLALHPGTKICQLVFQETKGQASYQGKFQHQQQP